MKNQYLLLITLFVFAFTYSNAQIVDIPDANFKYALVNFDCADLGNGYMEDVDINNDGEIQLSEAEEVLLLDVSSNNIASIEGIQYFTILSWLSCNSNNLTNLNLSQNPNIYFLDCSYNLISDLDFSQNLNLDTLYCNNNVLTSLENIQSPFVRYLRCQENQIENLDISYITNLEHLSCYYNQILNLDLTQNPNLTFSNIGGNQITDLDLSQNFNLEYFYCSANPLVNLDVSQNPNLKALVLTNNLLINLNIQNGNNTNLESFWAFGNPDLVCIQVDDENYANSQECNLNPPYNGWCKDDWAEYSEECELGLEGTAQINFTIYPNPTQDVLNIESQLPIETLKIYNLQGQLIKEDSNSSVDVSQLTTGLYFIQLSVDGKTSTKKFIKE